MKKCVLIASYVLIYNYLVSTVPSASAAAFWFVFYQFDLPPIDFCSIQLAYGILHVRVRGKFHNSVKGKGA